MSQFRRRSPWVSTVALSALLVGLHPRFAVHAQSPTGAPAGARPVAGGQAQPQATPQARPAPQAVAPAASQTPRVAQGPAAGGRPPAAQGAAPQQRPQRPQQPAAPQLSPEAAAALDRLLTAWESRNSAVKTWSCDFYKWEYNAFGPVGPSGDRLAFAESTGEIKYAMPDKGLFRVKESKQWNAQTSRYEQRPGDSGEHWVCNGTSIYEFRHGDRQLRETKLPPEMRGKAISDGPLPFVFGAKADTLKKRYVMRLLPTPAGVTDQVWLEALPRTQADAANFSKVELILGARDLIPFAIRIYKPGGQDQDVYQFIQTTSLIDKGLDLIRDFSKPVTPLGYTFILEDGAAAASAQQTSSPAPPPRNR